MKKISMVFSNWFENLPVGDERHFSPEGRFRLSFLPPDLAEFVTIEKAYEGAR